MASHATLLLHETLHQGHHHTHHRGHQKHHALHELLHGLLLLLRAVTLRLLLAGCAGLHRSGLAGNAGSRLTLDALLLCQSGLLLLGRNLLLLLRGQLALALTLLGRELLLLLGRCLLLLRQERLLLGIHLAQNLLLPLGESLGERRGYVALVADDDRTVDIVGDVVDGHGTVDHHTLAGGRVGGGRRETEIEVHSRLGGAGLAQRGSRAGLGEGLDALLPERGNGALLAELRNGQRADVAELRDCAVTERRKCTGAAEATGIELGHGTGAEGRHSSGTAETTGIKLGHLATKSGGGNVIAGERGGAHTVKAATHRGDGRAGEQLGVRALQRGAYLWLAAETLKSGIHRLDAE